MKLNPDLIDGQIVEMKTDTSISNCYRRTIKFSNGFMINTISQLHTSTATNNQWNGTYASNNYQVNNYLTPFKDVWLSQVTPRAQGNNHWLMAVNYGSTTAPPPVQFLRGTSGTSTGYVDVVAFGTWK